MNRFKTIAILLSLAIFNPLCCCLQLFGGVAQQQDTPAEKASHSCCSLVQEEVPSHADSHDASNCPHALEKGSQISQSVDALNLQAKEFCCPQPALDLAVWTLEPRAEIDPVSRLDNRFRLAESPPIEQSCCVRLL